MIKNEPLITRKQELPLKDNSTTLFLKVMISIAVFLFAVTLAGGAVHQLNAQCLEQQHSRFSDRSDYAG